MRHCRFQRARYLGLVLAMAALALPAHALYKVIGPDGKVTYTDRPPSTGDAKVTPLNATSSSVAPQDGLPFELRPIVARYPVTLYVTGDCPPCDEGRTMLRQRGIPFTEKLVVSNEDGEALQRVTGSRDAPMLMIGAQPLRGYSSSAWNAYLDAAGYPRESRLPANYQYPAATPMVEKREPPPPAPRAAPAPAAAAAPLPAASGIRF
jgi:glutaredoxin